MNMKPLTQSLVAALLLGGSSHALPAQDAAPSPCPFGHEPGYGRNLTPERRAEHREMMQPRITELRGKPANGA
jgi:hypothetical protein